MEKISDKIMAEAEKEGEGKWVATVKDYLHLGDYENVKKAMEDLVEKGKLSRAAEDVYYLPTYSHVFGFWVPVKVEKAVEAVARRDNMRIMEGGLEIANRMGITTAVPGGYYYKTDGPSKIVQIDENKDDGSGWDVEFKHVGEEMMFWKGRPGEGVVIALDWMGDHDCRFPDVTDKLRRIVPDDVKKDLLDNIDHLPEWMHHVIYNISKREDETPVPGMFGEEDISPHHIAV